jgi:membrane protease YdiL (CAAX protease family)
MNLEKSLKPPSIFTRIFFSPEETRLRAGWRLLLQTILLVVLVVLLSLAVYLPASASGLPVDSLLFGQINEFITISLSVFLARRFLDRRSFSSLGFKINRQTLVDLFVGFIISSLMMGFIYWAMITLNWTTFTGYIWQTQNGYMVMLNILQMLLVFILVGWNEELLSRGYHLQNLSEGINMTWAVFLSSAVFGGLHWSNPNATWNSVVGISLAGIFLAFAYTRTRMLWLPIGLHIGWNFFEGVVFGFPVSGLNTYHLIHHTVSGPELWTGGTFGPEAGLMLLPALILGTLLVIFYTRSLTPA